MDTTKTNIDLILKSIALATSDAERKYYEAELKREQDWLSKL